MYSNKINNYKKSDITYPELNCPECEVKTIIEIQKIYVCSDLRQVSSIDDCKTIEQKEVDNSEYDLVITINDAYLTKSISDYSIEDINSDEKYLIVDFSIYNKGIDEYISNPNYFLIEDSEGYSYGYSWDSASLRKYVGTVNIDKNTKKSMQLAFIVPKNETKFILVIQGVFGALLSKESFVVD